MNKGKVSVIILNWNGWKDTIECLESVYQNTYPNFEVIVVDNGSKDNSVEMIKKWADGTEKVSSSYFIYSAENKPIRYFEYSKEELNSEKYRETKKKFDQLPSGNKLFILKNDKNYGFAEGNNVAIRQVLKENTSDYLFLLNNDTFIPKDTISKFVGSYAGDKAIAIVGAKILNHSDKQFQDGAKYINLSSLNIKCINSTIPVFCDAISGCSFMIKIKQNLKVEPIFDKYYFCYYEDLDLCIKYIKYGYKILFNPNIAVFHKLSKSTGGDSNRSMFRLYYAWRNRLYFINKNSSVLNRYIYFLYFYIVYIPFVRIPASIFKYKSISELFIFFKAVKDFILYR